MSKKTFNSKQAAGIGGFDQSQFSSFENDLPEIKEVVSDRPDRDSETSRRPEPGQTFGPLEVFSLDPSRAGETNIKKFKDPETGEERTVELSDVYNPTEYAAREKDRLNRKMEHEIRNPESASYKRQLENYKMQDKNNRQIMGGVYGLITAAVRNSDKYKCPICKGAFKGGNESMPPERFQEQKVCLGCDNTGHTMRHPETELFNIHQSAKDYNTFIDFHNQNCKGGRCHNRCEFKPILDEEVREPLFNKGFLPKDIPLRATHSRSGSSERIKKLMRPKVVVDDYEPLAKGLKQLQGHESEPLRKFDFVHFINHDTINPDGKGTSSHEFYDNANLRSKLTGEGVIAIDNPSVSDFGPKDKQSFAIIHNITSRDANGNPLTANIIHHYRPVRLTRQEKRDRTKGRPDRNIEFDSTADAFDKGGELDQDKFDVKKHITNLYDLIRPYSGERSPMRGGTWGYQENVDVSRLHRVDDISAPLIATAGTVTKTIPRGKLKGWWSNGTRRHELTPNSLRQPVKADHIFRVATGFGEGQLKGAYRKITTNLAKQQFKQLMRDADEYRGVDPDHPDSLSNLTGSNEIRSGKPRIVNTMQRAVNQPGKQKFNVNVTTGLDAPSVPIEPIPDSIDLSKTPEGRAGQLEVIKAMTGKNKLTPQEEEAAIKGIQSKNHIDGGIEVFGGNVEKDNSYGDVPSEGEDPDEYRF